MFCLICHPHSPKSYYVKIASIGKITTMDTLMKIAGGGMAKRQTVRTFAVLQKGEPMSDLISRLVEREGE
jgi:hypothetical protein